jgi:prepilin-type N-terminal cleavage/methylation domain-containing protein
MMKILRNKKGMTLFEVLISITMLGVIAVPLMMLFCSSVILANKNRDKVDLNYIADIVVEEVRDSVKGNNTLPKYSSYDSSINDYTDYSIYLRDLVIQSKSDGTKKSTDKIGIIGHESSGNFRAFSYIVEYNHSECYDPNYNQTYEFFINIYNEDRMVKKLKIPVWAGTVIN